MVKLFKVVNAFKKMNYVNTKFRNLTLSTKWLKIIQYYTQKKGQIYACHIYS